MFSVWSVELISQILFGGHFGYFQAGLGIWSSGSVGESASEVVKIPKRDIHLISHSFKIQPCADLLFLPQKFWRIFTKIFSKVPKRTQKHHKHSLYDFCTICRIFKDVSNGLLLFYFIFLIFLKAWTIYKVVHVGAFKNNLVIRMNICPCTIPWTRERENIMDKILKYLFVFCYL